MYMGAKEPVTIQATVQKQNFCFGEEVRVVIKSDNTQCKKALKPVVVKLKMEIHLEGKMRGWNSY